MSETWGEALKEVKEDSRRINRRVASLELGARQQPHLAMEADVAVDKKTRERTESAATAVQAMHGDIFSANRVQAGPKTTSTSFGVKAEPPVVPCRDDVFWSRTALRRLSRVSHPWRCAQQQPPMAYFPPAKSLQRQGSPSTSQFFGSSCSKRQI